MSASESVAVCVTLSVGAGSFALAQPSFQGLGQLPGGSFQTFPAALSADGSVVVGWADLGSGGRTEAFRWTAEGGMVGLGFLPGGISSTALGVSGDGSVVVGTSEVNGRSRAFRWTAELGMVALPLLGTGDTNGANGISSDASIIVGNARESITGLTVAVLWTADNQIVPLGDLPGGSTTGMAYAASADGSVVVGMSRSDSAGPGSDVWEAFRWTAAAGMVGLGDLPGGTFESRALDVSADGSVVVGWGKGTSGFEAFRWTAAEGMVGLGDLPGGDDFSMATGITADGSIIVGLGRLDGIPPFFDQPFIHDATAGMRDLQTVLVDELGLDLTTCGYGWNLSQATAISADGSTVAGFGLNPVSVATGMVENEEGWVASIASQPAPGDIDGDGDVDFADLAIFVGCLNGPDVGTPPVGCDPAHFTNADINSDNDVDLGDFGEFQKAFTG